MWDMTRCSEDRCALEFLLLSLRGLQYRLVALYRSLRMALTFVVDG